MKTFFFGTWQIFFCEIKILNAMTISRLFYANILNRIYFDARVNIVYYMYQKFFHEGSLNVFVPCWVVRYDLRRRKNDVRFFVTPICFVGCSCFI
jgi:hypothetical protein